MSNLSTYFNALFFIALPYAALVLFFLISIRRYLRRGFTYSSLSSQFLENKQHFWALVPFHYGIITVLTVHIAAFLIPRQVEWWGRVPARLWFMEIGMLAAGLLTLAGLVGAMVRRKVNHKIAVVTSTADWIILVLLLLQIVSGLGVAILHPWGSSWFSIAVTPYLWSIVKLDPNIALVAVMPALVKYHIINAFLIIAFFPFTRLVHILVMPNPYLWRRPQVVRWYRRPQAARG